MRPTSLLPLAALADSEAMTCMKRAMYGLSFPQPKGSPMTVFFSVDGG